MTKIEALVEIKTGYARYVNLVQTFDDPTENRARMERLRGVLAQMPTLEADALQAAFKQAAQELGVKTGALVHPARLACTGRSIGPSLYHLMAVLGKEQVLRRVDRALERMPVSP